MPVRCTSHSASSSPNGVHPPRGGASGASQAKWEALAFARELRLSLPDARRLNAIVEQAMAEAAPQEQHHAHKSHKLDTMPFLSKPAIVQRPGEEQPEVHIGWADLYVIPPRLE